MILERIRLKGFLSHYGTLGDDGELVPTELDFTDADLWLVHGPNGAGKSAAVFDAIGFALYKQHRGGIQGAGSLVHQDAETATVSVDIDLGGQRYRISRYISKKTGSVRGELFEASGDGWNAIDFGSKLEDWVEHQLGMPFSTFKACILLRQGEADSFLKAKGKARRTALFDLVRLGDYERLEALARTRFKKADGEREHLAGEIGKRSDVSQDALAALVAQQETARRSVADAASRCDLAVAALEQATTAARLRSAIATERAAIAHHQELFDNAEQTEADAARHDALASVLPVLGALQRAQQRLAGAERELATLEEEFEAVRNDAPAFEAARHQAELASAAADAQALEATAAVSTLDRHLAGVKGQIGIVRAQIDRHDAVGGAASCPVCAADLDNETARERVAHHVSASRAQLDGLLADARNLRAQLDDAKTQRSASTTEQERSRATLVAAAQRAEASQTKLTKLPVKIASSRLALDAASKERDTLRADIPAEWSGHPAANHPDALAQLRDEHAALRDAPGIRVALQDARREVEPAQARLDDAAAQLKAVPEAYQQADPDTLGTAAASARVAVNDADANLTAVTKAVGAMEAALRELEALTASHDEHARTASRYKRLVEAFGPKLLQARVLRDAQSRVMRNANQTLSQLTNGGWSIQLDDNNEELTVYARDPLGNQRSFEYLSGGERFRVSLALAVGVGQTVSGGRCVRSLLIDEGFGALDDDGRALMVDELHRLRESVLGGGRVVVVAHQDDVKDQFDFRFRISKPLSGLSKGRAVVARSVPGDDL